MRNILFAKKAALRGSDDLGHDQHLKDVKTQRSPSVAVPLPVFPCPPKLSRPAMPDVYAKPSVHVPMPVFTPRRTTLSADERSLPPASPPESVASLESAFSCSPPADSPLLSSSRSCVPSPPASPTLPAATVVDSDLTSSHDTNDVAHPVVDNDKSRLHTPLPPILPSSKTVRFAVTDGDLLDVTTFETYPKEDYDRTSIEVSQLTPADIYEVKRMREEMYRLTSHLYAQRKQFELQMQFHQQHQQYLQQQHQQQQQRHGRKNGGVASSSDSTNNTNNAQALLYHQHQAHLYAASQLTHHHNTNPYLSMLEDPFGGPAPALGLSAYYSGYGTFSALPAYFFAQTVGGQL